MTAELTASIKVIHLLEMSIRVLELVRDRTQQVVNETIAGYEKQGVSAETCPTVVKARAHIAAYNRAILGSRAWVHDLERGD
jgi:hypothetical protein